MRGLLPGALSGGEYKLLQQMTTYAWMSKWVEIPFTLLSLPFTSLLIPFSPINSYNFMSIFLHWLFHILFTGHVYWGDPMGTQGFFPFSLIPFSRSCRLASSGWYQQVMGTSPATRLLIPMLIGTLEDNYELPHSPWESRTVPFWLY